MSEWKETELGNVCDLLDCLHKTPKYSGAGYPMVRVTDVKNGFLDTSKCLLVDKEVFNAFSKGHKPKGGDIIFTRVGSFGLSAIVKREEEFCIGQNTTLLLPKKIDPFFIFYFLIGDDARSQIEGLAGGSTQPTISMASIRKIVVPYPPLPEQKAIASVLSSLDDKIDLLHRQNLTLEAMAETLFRQWFVEEAQEDWEVGKVADLIEFNPTRKLAKGETAPYLEMAALSTTTFSPDGWYDREFTSGTKFINGDTLLARITPCLENGKAAFVMFLELGEVGWGSTEYIVMRPKKLLHPFFAYTLSRNRDFRDYAEGCMEGSSGRQRVNVDHLKNYEMKIPSLEAITEFNGFSESTVQKLLMNSNQIRTLEKLRDTLLPKLMSGEVRVAL